MAQLECSSMIIYFYIFTALFVSTLAALENDINKLKPFEVRWKKAAGSRGRVLISTQDEKEPPLMIVSPNSHGLREGRPPATRFNTQQNRPEPSNPHNFSLPTHTSHKLSKNCKNKGKSAKKPPPPPSPPPPSPPSPPLPGRIPFNYTGDGEEPGEDPDEYLNFPPLPGLQGPRRNDIAGPSVPFNNTIKYLGGAIQNNSIPVYIVFAGNWTRNERQIVTLFVSSLGDKRMRNVTGSLAQYWNIVLLYYDSLGNHVSPDIYAAGEVYYPMPFNSSLSDPAGLLKQLLTNGSLPVNTNAQYHVLTSPDIHSDGFCQWYCGYHTYFWWEMVKNGVRTPVPLAWSFVPNAKTKCPWNCGYPYINNPPNRDFGLDSQISVFSHEITEVATDPFISAWVNFEHPSGGEIADICSWNWGQVRVTESTGVRYTNEGKFGRYYFVQTLFHLITGECLNGIEVPDGECGPGWGGYPCLAGQCCNSGKCGVCAQNGAPFPPPKKLPPPPKRKSPPPLKKKSPPPIKKKSPPPLKKKAPPPLKKAPPPLKKKGPPPLKKKAPPPLKKKSPPPLKKKSPPPLKKKSPPPFKKKFPPPSKKLAPPPPTKPYLSSACGAVAPGFSLYPDTGANDVTFFITKATMSKCAAMCHSTTRCIAFMHSFADNRCRLKDGATKRFKAVGLDTFAMCRRIQGYAPPPPARTATPTACGKFIPGFKVQINMEYQLYTMKNVTGDPWSCSRTCAHTLNCQGFVHYSTKDYCLLKSQLKGSKFLSGADTYVRCT